MDFLCLDVLHCFNGAVYLVLNGELGKEKAVHHDDVLCWFFSEEYDVQKE